MKYDYQPIVTSIGHDGMFFWMPEVAITISGKNGNRRLFALVDSGASVCVADSAIAESAGIELNKKDMLYIGGVIGGGRGEPVYPANVTIKVEGLKELVVPVYFGKISRAFTFILGQKGFFDTHNIKFIKHRDVFEIVSIQQRNKS